jgi:hypothetical protein
MSRKLRPTTGLQEHGETERAARARKRLSRGKIVNGGNDAHGVSRKESDALAELQAGSQNRCPRYRQRPVGADASEISSGGRNAAVRRWRDRDRTV